MKVAKSPSSDSAKGLDEEPFSVMPHEHGSGGRRAKKCARTGGKVAGNARRVSAMRDQYALAWPLDEALANRLARLFIRMFKSDAARLTAPLGKTIFLIIGETRHTKYDSGQWVDQDGNVQNWSYVAESCIASGDTVGELVGSAKRYKRLQNTTAERLLSPDRRTKIGMIAAR